MPLAAVAVVWRIRVATTTIAGAKKHLMSLFPIHASRQRHARGSTGTAAAAHWPQDHLSSSGGALVQAARSGQGGQQQLLDVEHAACGWPAARPASRQS